MMTKTLGKFLTTSALAAGLLAVGTPASADFLDFTVHEGVVPGTPVLDVLVDKINGGYTEIITFDGVGGFKVSAYADFGKFFNNEGSNSPSKWLDSPEPVGYGLYALFTASGQVIGNSLVGNAAQVNMYVDPLQDTTLNPSILVTAGVMPTPAGSGEDLEVLNTNVLISGVGGVVPGVGGFFDFVFGHPTFTPFGLTYLTFPSGIVIRTVVDGDFDEFALAGTQTVTGDVSVVFNDATVPEPATLSLLGLGLGSAAWARRRKQKNAKS